MSLFGTVFSHWQNQKYYKDMQRITEAVRRSQAARAELHARSFRIEAHDDQGQPIVAILERPKTAKKTDRVNL